MKKYAIIVAAGTGSRMNSETPKQFLIIDGKPVLWHSLDRFHTYDKNVQIIVALHREHFALWHQLRNTYHIDIPHFTVEGGNERFHSVKNALHYVPGGGLVAVHDAARPFISLELIENLYKQAEEKGSGVPAIDMKESVRILSDDKWKAFDRNLLKIIQTPQVFDAEKLKKAYSVEFEPSFTDDASVFEAAGFPIELFPGEVSNRKITFKEDL